MKILGIKDAQRKFTKLFDICQEHIVIFTRHSKPVAVLKTVEGKELETVIVEVQKEEKEMEELEKLKNDVKSKLESNVKELTDHVNRKKGK